MSLLACHTFDADTHHLVGPGVVFMLKQLGLNGAGVTPANIQCTPCDASKAGGFSPDAGAVVLCQGRFFSKSHMEDTIVHELVHMYDHTKFKVNWSDLHHHACSEVGFPIRA
jgi:inner membrane protease ATP23